ncbi:hypothetical protein IWQ60_003522 [Tieghemiomyces parasiticus]|uniref:Calcium-activated potassium channel BK alpha subunit domain-containing protein n=1 Tax=Tieghemiomyces parasiticus TaxID=78921 RepID=A0A9W8A9F9_9FUNG|nr:hypothetical protein IWQ60_003522 [Tieghemiomyces parasiticus]
MRDPPASLPVSPAKSDQMHYRPESHRPERSPLRYENRPPSAYVPETHRPFSFGSESSSSGSSINDVPPPPYRNLRVAQVAETRSLQNEARQPLGRGAYGTFHGPSTSARGATRRSVLSLDAPVAMSSLEGDPPVGPVEVPPGANPMGTIFDTYPRDDFTPFEAFSTDQAYQTMRDAIQRQTLFARGKAIRAEPALRQRLAFYIDTTQVGRAWDLLDALVNFLLVLVYVWNTQYVTEVNPRLPFGAQLADLALAGLLLLLFLPRYYLAAEQLTFARSFQSLTTLLATLPPIAAFFLARFDPQFDATFMSAGFLIYVYPIRIVRLQMSIFSCLVPVKSGFMAFSAITRKALRLGLGILTTLLTVSAFVHLVTYIQRKPTDALLDFGEAFFFTTVSSTSGLSTDLVPDNAFTRIVILYIMIVGAVFIPANLSELLTLMARQSRYPTRFTPAAHQSHVLLVGRMEPMSLFEFLREFFCEDHGLVTVNTVVVIMGAEDPPEDVANVLNDPAFVNRVKYVRGSPTSFSNLQKVCANRAKACFLLTNKMHTSQDPEVEDATTVMFALAVKKYCRTMNKRLKLYAQVLVPETETHLEYLTNRTICVDELRLGLLAQSCVIPGFASLIHLLTTSITDSTSDKILESLEGRPHMNWIKEYVRGASQEIYSITFSDFVVGNTFSQVAEVFYAHFGATLFALRLQLPDTEAIFAAGEPTTRSKKWHLVINPARHVLQGNETGFVIATTSEIADAISQFGGSFLPGTLPGETSFHQSILVPSSPSCQRPTMVGHSSAGVEPTRRPPSRQASPPLGFTDTTPLLADPVSDALALDEIEDAGLDLDMRKANLVFMEPDDDEEYEESGGTDAGETEEGQGEPMGKTPAASVMEGSKTPDALSRTTTGDSKGPLNAKMTGSSTPANDAEAQAARTRSAILQKNIKQAQAAAIAEMGEEAALTLLKDVDEAIDMEEGGPVDKETGLGITEGEGLGAEDPLETNGDQLRGTTTSPTPTGPVPPGPATDTLASLSERRREKLPIGTAHSDTKQLVLDDTALPLAIAVPSGDGIGSDTGLQDCDRSRPPYHRSHRHFLEHHNHGRRHHRRYHRHHHNSSGHGDRPAKALKSPVPPADPFFTIPRDLGDHIVICDTGGAFPPNLEYFIGCLRVPHRDNTPVHSPFSATGDLPIVILSKNEPSGSQQRLLASFGNVYMVRGSALIRKDLFKAHIHLARKAVVLSGLQHQSGDSTQHTADASALLAVLNIESLSQSDDFFIVVEFIHRENMKFIGESETVPIDEMYAQAILRPSFMSGHVFAPCMLDTLICQTYYNNHILDIVKHLIFSHRLADDTVQLYFSPPPLAAATTVETEPCLVDTQAPEDEDSASENSIPPNGGVESEPPVTTNLYGHSFLVDVPAEFFGRLYLSLFTELCRVHCAVPLGLYRAVSHNRHPLCYVLVNPGPTMVLRRGDRVYVLSDCAPY